MKFTEAIRRSPIYCILRLKCPHCHTGEFFYKNPYNLKHLGDLHAKCLLCHQSNHPEPGFYQGALYVSYGFGVGLFMGMFLFLNVLSLTIFHMSMEVILIAMIVLMILLSPYTYALSKITWAKMNITFKGLK